MLNIDVLVILDEQITKLLPSGGLAQAANKHNAKNAIAYHPRSKYQIQKISIQNTMNIGV